MARRLITVRAGRLMRAWTRWTWRLPQADERLLRMACAAGW